MATLQSLQRQAAKSTAWRGHRMHWNDQSNGCRRGICLRCAAWVILDTKPAPNGIDIGGTAVALNCPVVNARDKWEDK
jgi:hypothetical protein